MPKTLDLSLGCGLDKEGTAVFSRVELPLLGSVTRIFFAVLSSAY